MRRMIVIISLLLISQRAVGQRDINAARLYGKANIKGLTVNGAKITSDTTGWIFGFGKDALKNNSGTEDITAFGNHALENNNSNVVTAFGDGAGRYNLNYENCFFGTFAGYKNLGWESNLFGAYAGWYNTAEVDLQGYMAGMYNVGTGSTGVGGFTLRYNSGTYNTALGYDAFNTWTTDIGSAKTFDYTDIKTTGNDTITITGHSFGSNGVYVNLFYEQGTASITGMTDSTVYQFYIVDENTLSGRSTAITAAGTGTGHKLTPQTVYTNSTALGYNSEPDASNQIKLGNTSVTSIKSSGAFISTGTGKNIFPKVEITDSLTVNSSGKYIRKIFQSISGDSLGFIYYNTILSRVDTVYMTQ